MSVNQMALYKSVFRRFHGTGRWRGERYYARYRRALQRKFVAVYGIDPFQRGTAADVSAAEEALQAAALDPTLALQFVAEHGDMDFEVSTTGPAVRLSKVQEQRLFLPQKLTSNAAQNRFSMLAAVRKTAVDVASRFPEWIVTFDATFGKQIYDSVQMTIFVALLPTGKYLPNAIMLHTDKTATTVERLFALVKRNALVRESDGERREPDLAFVDRDTGQIAAAERILPNMALAFCQKHVRDDVAVLTPSNGRLSGEQIEKGRQRLKNALLAPNYATYLELLDNDDVKALLSERVHAKMCAQVERYALHAARQFTDGRSTSQGAESQQAPYKNVHGNTGVTMKMSIESVLVNQVNERLEELAAAAVAPLAQPRLDVRASVCARAANEYLIRSSAKNAPMRRLQHNEAEAEKRAHARAFGGALHQAADEAASEEALLDLADMQVRGEMFASACESLQCTACKQNCHPDFYDPELFRDAAAHRELTPLALHKREFSHLIWPDPLSRAVCALCSTL
jgi:hypothetical protein